MTLPKKTEVQNLPNFFYSKVRVYPDLLRVWPTL